MKGTSGLKANEITQIVDQLKQVHTGGAWHGPSVREALDGVSGSLATAHPIAGAHSIADIVHHLAVVSEAVRADLVGAKAPEEADWPADGVAANRDGNDEAWRAAVARLEAAERALRDAAASFPESRLQDNVAGKSHSYAYELHGLLNHDAYHAGQISLLKKAR
jgi:uncharacterized damage-inducible protein DinB